MVRENFEAPAGSDRHPGVFRTGDDAAERAIDVSQKCRADRIFEQDGQHRVGGSHALSIAGMDARRIAGLGLVGTAAGVFSGLFGVGGGAVIVPLLIALFAYGERRATGTSLAAIILIASFAAVAHGGIYGNLDLKVGLILSVPAVIGVVAGTSVQQRLPERTISVIFSILLVAVAIDMVFG